MLDCDGGSVVFHCSDRRTVEQTAGGTVFLRGEGVLGWYRGTSTPYGTMYGGYPVVPTSHSLFSIIHHIIFFLILQSSCHLVFVASVFVTSSS